MTLDLDELERKAKAACDLNQSTTSCTDYGIERDADVALREHLYNASGGYAALGIGSAYGAPVILALIERIREAEEELRIRDDAALERSERD